MLATFTLMFLLGISIKIYFVVYGSDDEWDGSELQKARQVGQVLYSYAQDHNGKYPEGKSSTEVFQKLIDEDYVSDPSIFGFPMAGKKKAKTTKLKPENVCWDLTDAVRSEDPDTLPLVISTGYRIDYLHGGIAYPLANADPAGIAIFLKGDNVFFLSSKAGGITLLRPPYLFAPKGRTYRQLTPDGALP